MILSCPVVERGFLIVMFQKRLDMKANSRLMFHCETTEWLPSVVQLLHRMYCQESTVLFSGHPAGCCEHVEDLPSYLFAGLLGHLGKYIKAYRSPISANQLSLRKPLGEQKDINAGAGSEFSDTGRVPQKFIEDDGP